LALVTREGNLIKNLVVFHLESLNNLTYKLDEHLFPDIIEMEEKSISYKNYFSTATSTFMVIADMFYGNMLQYENSSAPDNLVSNNFQKESIFDILNSNGYDIYSGTYPVLYKEEMNYCKLLGNTVTTEYCASFSKFIQNMKDKSSKQPFAMFLSDNTGHLYYSDHRKETRKNSITYWENGYKNINHSFKNMVEALKENNVLNDTIIVAYGDHGDDFWGHNLNSGLCHGIEPYTNVINTPLFIYNSDIEPKKVYDLIQTTDISTIIFNMMKIKGHNNRFIYDIYRCNREYVFSRNLYANQTFNHSKLNKGYCIANGEYNLILTKRGLELYAYRLDRSNASNLLDFFRMNTDEELEPYKMHNMHVHFTKFMTERQKEDIKNSVNLLVVNLKKELAFMYKNLKDIKKENKVKAIYFKRIHYKKRLEYLIENQVRKISQDINSLKN
jgi:membrane-anchored protein YejM (alkaline phosphatase superfamily)